MEQINTNHSGGANFEVRPVEDIIEIAEQARKAKLPQAKEPGPK